MRIVKCQISNAYNSHLFVDTVILQGIPWQITHTIKKLADERYANASGRITTTRYAQASGAIESPIHI